MPTKTNKWFFFCNKTKMKENLKSLGNLKITLVVYTEKNEGNSLLRDNGRETTSIQNVQRLEICDTTLLDLERKWRMKGAERLTWSAMAIFSFPFLDTHNYNYLKQRSHWEHANFRSTHLQKFWVVYWQPLLIWNVARRNTLFWISGHWNIFKRLLIKNS